MHDFKLVNILHGQGHLQSDAFFMFAKVLSDWSGRAEYGNPYFLLCRRS